MPTWLSLVGTIVQYNIREQASIDGALKEDLHQRIAGDCNIMEHRIGEERQMMVNSKDAFYACNIFDKMSISYRAVSI
jgi:hypothetical protein